MHPSTRLRSAAAALAATALVAAAGCSESTADGSSDLFPPTISMTPSASSVDSVLAFSAHVRDNLGVKRIHIETTGGVTAQYDTVFTTAVTDITVPLIVSVPRSVPSGTPINVLGTVFDGAGNKSAVDTLHMTAGNLTPATVTFTSPVSGSIAVIGKSIILSISGTSKVRVSSLGYSASGVFTGTDSTVFASPLKDTTSVLDTLTIPAGTQPGSLVLTPFIRDSLGNHLVGTPITVTVQAASNVSAPPIVNFGVESRIEVNDTLFVSAIDTSGAGIDTLGWEIRTTPTGAVAARGQFASNSQFTSQQHTFSLAIPASLATSLPKTLYITAYGVTATHAKGYAKLSNGVQRMDTLTLVAGVTRGLPSGGLVADAYYHPRWDRLYLTNITRDQVEVFSLADSTFHTAIPVGSRPWGITVWPRDRNGTASSVGDTLLVANSGGTSIGFINLADRSIYSEGREVYTYPLPNLVAYTVTTVSSATTGQPIQQRTAYNFSSRPQYVAATCKTPSLANNTCSEVLLVYSTTPTAGQSTPFPNRGTLRYENLTTKQSHFFFEQAMGQGLSRSDTLEVERFGAGCTGAGTLQCVGSADSILVPARQLFITAHTPSFPGDTRLADTTVYSIVVDITKLAFFDTTFVRNSGNFQRTIAGENNLASNSRVIGYDVMRGMQTTTSSASGSTLSLPTPSIDNGVSHPLAVTDFIANTSARVSGVGINFDGELSAVRADSIYLIDSQLRLQGTMQTSTSGNPGFDFNPKNSGNGVTSARQACYLFAASTEPVIEVYENHYYQRVATIPVKSPIIGPIKSAYRIATGQIMLIGATARGVVIVTLPPGVYTGCPQ